MRLRLRLRGRHPRAVRPLVGRRRPRDGARGPLSQHADDARDGGPGGGRTLGIDFGERRIGLALSDPTGTLATPLETVRRRAGKRPPLARLEAIARERGAAHLVVGLPLGLDGKENEWCGEVRRVAENLAERLDVGVSYMDERLTSVRAERAVRSMGLPKHERERKERVDAAAAQLILQAWLDNPEAAR